MVRCNWGNVHVVINKAGRLLYCWPRKKYTRTHPYPKHIDRHQPFPREKAAYNILRNLGYPINMLAKVSGRSTSFLKRIYDIARQRHTIKWIDMRKYPKGQRYAWPKKRWITLLKYWPLWMAWLQGEGEKPP